MGSVSPRPPLLGPEQPRWDFVRLGKDSSSGSGTSGERLLITICVHGNEPCGLLAANELLEEGFFDSAAGEGAWPHTWDRLTVLLGNPAGLQAGKRFIDTNLNRLFLPEEERRGSSSSIASTVEQACVPELAAAIAQSTAHVDIHSSSAPSVPFCFHFPGEEAAAFAASFPVAFAIDDTSIRGTTIHWAHQQGQPKSILVECGQHDARQSVEVAKRCIRRLVLGPGWQRGHPAAHAAAAAAQPQRQASASMLEPAQGSAAASTQAAEPAAQPSAAAGAGSVQLASLSPAKALKSAQALRTAGSVYVGAGFRWRQDVTAFQLVSRGDVIAEDDEQGAISCPHDTARIVMPTHLPVAGEEAWLWGVEA